MAAGATCIGRSIATGIHPHDAERPRDMKAARRFFRSARSVAGFVPDRVTTDGHNSYPRAIRSTLGRNVRHRTNVYLNNRLEQDHRGSRDASDVCAASRSTTRRTGSAESMMNSATSSAADPVTTNTFRNPPTPSLSPARPHRDGHHADRIIRRFRPRDALQTARDVTGPAACRVTGITSATVSTRVRSAL